jgi:hypothetical protein
MNEGEPSKKPGKDLDKRVESYREGLLSSKGVKWAPEMVEIMTKNYAKSLEAITSSPKVKERIEQLVSGSSKVKVVLLRLWTATRVRKVKGFNLYEVVVGLVSIIERNGIPLNLAKEVLKLAGYTEQRTGNRYCTVYYKILIKALKDSLNGLHIYAFTYCSQSCW